MEVFINRKPIRVEAPMSLGELLTREGIPSEVAVAVNNRGAARRGPDALEEGINNHRHPSSLCGG